MRFGILGPVEVRAGERSVSAGSAREGFVLAQLLIAADQITPAERLIDALWNDPPPSARAQVHNLIRNLRRRLKELSDDVIETRPFGYELQLGDHEFDLAEFRRGVDRGRAAQETGDQLGALDSISRALELWRGPALAGVGDDLARHLRDSLHDERTAASVSLLEAHLALGHHDAVLGIVRPLIAEHPYREHFYELQMRALALSGRRADALDTYQHAYRRLADDLGVQPSEDLRTLERAILDGASLDSGGTVRVATVPIVPCEVPALNAALVGRAKLLDEICDELRRRDSGDAPPIGLLVGPGGIGKSALAISAAHRLRSDYPDGTLFANLRGSHESPTPAHDAVGRLLRSLGVDGSRIPTDPDERTARYRSMLADRRILVVLDDAGSEEQVRPLIPSGGGCGLIVTSRRSLAALVPVPRWTIPPLLPADGARLLATIIGPERAAHEASATESIAELCGHLPLAVCVAGARLAANPTWRLTELEERLTDERARLDELAVGDIDVRAGIALTYESLASSRRTLFRRLGLIPTRDWPLWVAEELVGDTDVRGVLDDLTDVHLVEPIGRDAVDQTRFRLHDLVAEFALERALAEESEADRVEALARVISGWIGLAAEADERTGHGKRPAEGLAAPPAPPRPAEIARQSASAWFETELSSLFSAVDLACAQGNFPVAAELALRMSGFLTVRAYDEDRERVQRSALAIAPANAHADLRIRLLGELFTTYAQRARFAELPALAAQHLEAARSLGNLQRQQYALMQSGWAANNVGRFVAATEFFQEALAIIPADEQDPGTESRLRLHLGAVLAEQGDNAGGEPLFAEGIAALRAAGPSRQLVVCLTGHADILTQLARYEEAAAVVAEARGICGGNGDDLGVANVELRQADIDLRTRRLHSAAERLRRAVPVLDEHAEQEAHPEGLRLLGDLAAAESRWGDAARSLRKSADIWHQVSVPHEVARTVARLERVYAAAGDEASAAECRRHWEQILADLGIGVGALMLSADYPYKD